MHYKRTLLSLLIVLAAPVVLTGCGGSAASIPSGTGVGARQAASDELRAGEDTVFGRLFDTYSPPATTLTGTAASDPLSVAYDPSMFDTSSLDSLSLDSDTMATLDSTDIGSLDAAGTTFDAAWNADSPTYGATGGMMNVAALSGPMSGVDDPSLDDPSLDDPSLDDPAVDDPSLDDPAISDASFDAPDMALDDQLDVQNVDLGPADF
mgnify:CR=1 FL=1